jgi:hypothetical protein
MSAVDQGYRYAINLPCDWIIVTSMRQTRLYHKGSDQQTYERFDTEQLADDEAALRRFLFLLAAERVVPAAGRCHFYDLLAESEQVGRELTKKFYVSYVLRAKVPSATISPFSWPPPRPRRPRRRGARYCRGYHRVQDRGCCCALGSATGRRERERRTNIRNLALVPRTRGFGASAS